MDRLDTLITDPQASADTTAQASAPGALDLANLPSLTTETARQHRLAVDARLRAMLAHMLGVTSWSVNSRNPIAPANSGRLSLRWGNETASVYIDLSQHPRLASIVQASEIEQRGPSGLRDAVAAIVLAALPRALATLGVDGIEIVALQRAAPPPSNHACCALAMQLGDQHFDAVLGHIDPGWFDALELVVTRQCTPLATHISQIEVPGRLQIGERSISITTLSSLKPGDIILRALPQGLRAFFTNQTPSVTLPVVWGRYGTRQLRALAHVESAALTLTEDPTMSHDTHFSAPLTDSVDSPMEISNLDLPLKLEIDTVSLPVSQLSALRAGYVLELPTSVPEARIRLVTYGQTIGFGELVTVGDHLGVRLVQLAPSHGSV
jgi:type III secretion protein Q